MLKIRLTRTGKKRQPSYRVVVAEHTSPIKSNFVDIVGFYNVSRTPRELELDQEKVKYWLSVGAQPSDTVAGLLKGLGFEGMDKFIGPRDLKRKKKKTTPEDSNASSGSAKVTESPVEEEAPAVMAEEPVAEPVAEAAPEPAEAPAPEAAKEEAPKEEAVAAEEKTEEESPKEEAEKTPASEEKTEEAS